VGHPRADRARAATLAPVTRRRPALWPLAVLVLLLVGLPVAFWVRDALERDPSTQEVRDDVDA